MAYPTNAQRPLLTKQYLVVFILDKLTMQLFNCHTYPFNNPGDQPRYPFVTFQMINSHHSTTADYRSDQFEITLQLDVHTNDTFKSSEMAEKLYDALNQDSSYREYFTQANIVPRKPDTGADVQDHTVNLFGLNYDISFGFDVKFQISQANRVYEESELNFKHLSLDIETVRATDSVDGYNIDASKRKKGDNA